MIEIVCTQFCNGLIKYYYKLKDDVDSKREEDLR
jgi:hypothetical protein